MIAGIRNSRAEKHIFRHNDPTDLERALAGLPSEQAKLVCFGSVYSMDGDIAPFGELCDIADRYGAMTHLNEVHAVTPSPMHRDRDIGALVVALADVWPPEREFTLAAA